jgi:hypothetical protein
MTNRRTDVDADPLSVQLELHVKDHSFLILDQAAQEIARLKPWPRAPYPEAQMRRLGALMAGAPQLARALLDLVPLAEEALQARKASADPAHTAEAATQARKLDDARLLVDWLAAAGVK